MRPIHLACALGALMLLAACREAPPAPPPEPQPMMQGEQLHYPANHPQLALLKLATAAPGKAVPVDIPAKLVWDETRTQRVYPSFAGRVTSIQADVGQSVKPGQVLAQLASPDFGAAQADAAKADVDMRLAQKVLARQHELYGAGVIARKELEQTEADMARARAEAARANARVRLYGAGSAVNQQLAIKAGLGGVVVERNLNPGQELRPDLAGPGVPPLFTITDPRSLWVQIDARESEVGTLGPGASFELRVAALPGEVFKGQVVVASDFIDPATRTIKVRGTVPNAERRLKGEMLATARVERTLGSGVVVPATAVLLSGTRHRVYVQVKPGVFEVRGVVVRHEGPREVLVSSGLEVGEEVVRENALLLAREFRIAHEQAGQAPTNPVSAPAAAAHKP